MSNRRTKPRHTSTQDKDHLSVTQSKAVTRGRKGGEITLILLKVVPSVSILMNGRNRPIQVIKGGEETPLKTPPSCLPPSLRDVVLQCKGEALPRLVLRVGGG